VAFDERAEAQPFIQLAHQKQAAVGTHTRTLEVNPQPATERELKGLFLRVTHRRSTSPPPRSYPNPHLLRLFHHCITLVVHLENGNPGKDAFVSFRSKVKDK
jgi:hypothetical protein